LQNYIYAASFQMAVETTTPDEYLSLKMISNAKNWTKKVVNLDEIYNFHINFISIRIHIESYKILKMYWQVGVPTCLPPFQMGV
jgi:hypothetical protein